MKKIIIVFFILVFTALNIAAKTPAPVQSPEQEGDARFARRNSITDTAADLINMLEAVEFYRKAYEHNPADEKLFLKFGKAYDFTYSFLTGTAEEKKKAYETFIAQYGSAGKTITATKEYNYVMAVMWARKGDMTANQLEAAKDGVADTIRKYAEALYNIDKTFEGYAAGHILGRLHYKSPNIVFVLKWPNKNKSREYLEEILKAEPDDTEVKYFLADTLWELDKKEEAKRLYISVSNGAPRREFRYYDNLAIKNCRDRMKELHLGD
jgi:hypothetical protein